LKRCKKVQKDTKRLEKVKKGSRNMKYFAAI